MTLLAILFLGWPSAILGFAFLVAGIVNRMPAFALTGAVIAGGFCLYLAMNPLPFRLVGLLALLCNGASAVTVVRKAPRLVSFALMLPFVSAASYLVFAIRSAS
jgi:hypothetical protein